MSSAQVKPFFIVNPVAGRGRATSAEPVIVEVLRDRGVTDASVVRTEAPGHATALAEEASREGWTPVVGVGGDGTLQEIANGLVRSGGDSVLGAVPAGAGNDFGRSMGLPSDTRQAVEEALGGPVRTIDLSHCGERYFLNAGGVGFDAEVARAVTHAPRALRFGSVPYVVYVLRELVRHRKHDLTVEVDGEVIERRSLFVAVANGPFYGGGMMICPEARRDDGMLDVRVVGEMPRREVLRLLPKVFSGGHVGHPLVDYRRAAVVRVGGDSTWVHLDGEPQGTVPVEFRAEPGALRVVGGSR